MFYRMFPRRNLFSKRVISCRQPPLRFFWEAERTQSDRLLLAKMMGGEDFLGEWRRSDHQQEMEMDRWTNHLTMTCIEILRNLILIKVETSNWPRGSSWTQSCLKFALHFHIAHRHTVQQGATCGMWIRDPAIGWPKVEHDGHTLII